MFQMDTVYVSSLCVRRINSSRVCLASLSTKTGSCRSGSDESICSSLNLQVVSAVLVAVGIYAKIAKEKGWS